MNLYVIIVSSILFWAIPIYGKVPHALSNLTPGEIPIVASTVFNSNVGPREGDLVGVRECGFNLCMETASSKEFDKLLKFMNGSGLKILLQDWSFQINSRAEDSEDINKFIQFIKKYKDNPLVAGWKFYDEPKWDLLPELKKLYNVLIDTDSSHSIYINLVGEIVKSHTGPCRTLPEYLNYIQKEFPMDVWSFDCYPIWIRNGQFMVRYKDFYTALEAYANKSNETGIPMWAYCESMAFKAKHHDIPAATESHLSFEAFSALAYGAQGIVYWTYSMRPSSSTETYVSALVDMDGNKTPAWYAAQSVNHQIRALTPVFLGAKMEEVRHSGNIPLDGVRPFIENFGPIERLTNGDKGVLVSHLTNNGRDYLVIVNHDVQNKQNVRLKFRDEVHDICEIKVSSSGNLVRQKAKGIRKVSLSPGGYVIYQWNNSK